MPKKVNNVLAITYWSYRDALIQTYTLPYLRMILSVLPQGSKIILMTFEQQHLTMTKEQWLKEKHKLAGEGILLYRMKYHGFGVLAFLQAIIAIVRLIILSFRFNINTVHAWCTPAGMFAYFVAKFGGKRLIIDSYEPHAESMVENGQWTRNSLSFRLLFRYEKKMTAYAHACIATSWQMKEYAKETYGIVPQRFFVKPAGVDTVLFQPDALKRNIERKKLGISDEAIVCVYIGKFGGIYLDKEIFRLIKAAQQLWKEQFEMVIYTSTSQEFIEQHIALFNLNSSKIKIFPYAEHANIPAVLSIADFAINPVKPVPSKRYCTSIKDGEYWAMGLPVIITPNISDDSELIEKEGIGVVWDDFTDEGCSKTIAKMNQLLMSENLRSIRDKIRQLAITHREFTNAQKIYLDLYSTK